MGVLIPFPEGRRPTTIRPREGYLTKRGVADYLGVSTRTVERYQAAMGLPGYRVGGRNLYRRTEVDSWVAGFGS